MSIDTRLAQLEHAQLVRRAEDPDPAYLFRHTLTQETAYESLLLKRRREMHLLVAQSYERLYPQRLDELAAVLAQHYAQVGDDAKTVEYAERAGYVAARVYAQVEARVHYAQALSAIARLPISVEQTRKKIDLVLKYFDVTWATGATQSVLELIDEIESLAATLTGVGGEAPSGDRLRLARIHYSRGSLLLARGQLPEALSYFYKVAEEARSARRPLYRYPTRIDWRRVDVSGTLSSGVAVFGAGTRHITGLSQYLVQSGRDHLLGDRARRVGRISRHA